MPDYLIFQAQVPPHFSYEDYRARSNEPIRYEVVTVVEADTPAEAINALTAALGHIASGTAAVECHHIGFEAKSKLGPGGKLIAPTAKELTEGEDN